MVRYSSDDDDDVTEVAIEAILAHEPKLRALRILAAEARDEALSEYSEDGQATDADLSAFVGFRIQEHHGTSIAGMMSDAVNWADVAAVVLRSLSEEG